MKKTQKKENSPFSQLLLIARISIFFIVLCAFNMVANTHLQKTMLTLNLKGAPLEEAISQIEKQSEFVFFYQQGLFNNHLKVNVCVHNEKIGTVLSEIFDKTNIDFALKDQLIILSEKGNQQDIKNTTQAGIIITGTVRDAQNEPLTGVSVSLKGKSVGTITDIDGRYSIAATSAKDMLVFSYIGYLIEEKSIGNLKEINLIMRENTQLLEEVVVVGYGSQKKTDLTGSVGVISSDKLKERPVVNFGEAMAGQMAGVQVQEINGAPGGEGLSIRVRGTGSITQSNDPLYVVDGYPMEEGAFRLINPSDIESIQVLKDASSTAIYGSRGANGVVIISTKKGSAGAPSISLNAYYGVQQREKTVKMMNRDQYIDWFKDGRNQAWLDQAIIAADPNKSPHSINDPNSRRKLYPNATSTYVIPDGTDGWVYNFNDPASVATMPDTNWQDELFRNAAIQQYELSVYGGSDRSKYALTGSYIDQDGIMIGTNYQRFNFRTSLSSKLTKFLEIGMNLNAYYGNGHEQANGKDAPIMYALSLPPIYPVRNPDGTYGSMVRNPEILAGDTSSPIGIAENRDAFRKRYGWLGTIFAELDLLKELKYRISINGSVQDNNYSVYEPSTLDKDASKAPRPAMGSDERKNDVDWVIEQTLTYNNTFAGKHALTVMGGYTAQKHQYERMYGEARTFPNDNIHTLNAGTMYSLSSEIQEYAMVSYLARANYTYDSRYLLTATIRTDGSSRFGQNNRWGTFPSASLGWRISEESFMKNVSPINNLKLRASYGIVGNNRIGNYSAIGLLSNGFYPTSDALQSTVAPSTMANQNLSWEKTKQVNLGFDLGLFESRIRLEADFYNSQSIDLLLDVPMPTITGYSTQMQNVGKVQNKGMEFLLSTQNLVGRFKWSSDFNISFNKNKVLAVGPDGRPIYGSPPNAPNSFITMPGHPIASYYGYVYEGVFMTQEELDSNPHLSVDKVGDGRYKDINDDHVMDSKDQKILGDNNPIFVAGLNNSLNYKNFSLDFQFTGSYGAKLFSFFKRMIGIYHGDRNALIEQLGRWRSPEEPGDGWHFRATRNPSGWQRTPSSAWITDGSYLRLRNLTFSYTFDSKVIQKAYFKSLRLYVTGQNLYTWTKYPGYDPETSSEGSGLTKGGDYIGYPVARSFILGANISF